MSEALRLAMVDLRLAVVARVRVEWASVMASWWRETSREDVLDLSDCVYSRWVESNSRRTRFPLDTNSAHAASEQLHRANYVCIFAMSNADLTDIAGFSNNCKRKLCNFASKAAAVCGVII